MAAASRALDIDTAGIVGAGVMGAGIAEVFAAGGLDVFLVDSEPGKAKSAIAQIASRQLARAAAGKADPDTVEKLVARIRPLESLNGLVKADLVVEAIVERLEPKQDLVRSLETIVGPQAIIATNTSSLSVTGIAAAAKRPERVAGYHFFNPVPAMKLVEIIRAAHTAPEVEDALVKLTGRFGHRAVLAADTPGFIVNHAGRAFGTEALAILREGVASIPEIDAILRDAAGFRMGPFELMDLTGLDVSHPVMESIYGQFYHDPRYRPSVIAAQRVAAGLLGRKTGRGFYEYEGNRQILPDPVEQDLEPVAPQTVVVVGDGEDGQMRSLLEAAGHSVTKNPADAKSGNGLVLVGLEGEDVAGAVTRRGLSAASSIGFDPFFGIDRHVTLVTSGATSKEAAANALALLSATGRKATVVGDSCGAICQRTVAMIVNIGCAIVEQNIASPVDVDAAVKLGLGYPHGPLEWGDRVGATRIVRILDAIHDRTRDPRYRASLWLRRRAELELTLSESRTGGR
ncbi:3-hydroxyacyl-CoA dehydrogenase [Mesorhizobium sp. CN2-181]|uniref:3-hydroxyacyl-CoA dehydrogenase n=1 Tax=Mesorhizobium yinganensis TaxID=3157707 RepID=UPI0032B7D458